MPLFLAPNPEISMVSPWSTPTHIVAAASTDAPDPRSVAIEDPSLFMAAVELRESLPAPVKSHWGVAPYAAMSWTFQPDVRSDSASSRLDYWFADDIPSIILGDLTPETRIGPVGYWKTLGASSFHLFSAPNFEATELLTSLNELEDGWNGLGSSAPSVAVKNDVARVLYVCSTMAEEPAIEVDDDGTVALLWEQPEKTIALTILGNGKVVGTRSPLHADMPPWTLAVDDASLAARLHLSKTAQLSA